MHIGPRPLRPPFDGSSARSAPGASWDRLRPVLLSIGAAVLIVGAVLAASALGTPSAGDGTQAVAGP